MAVTRFVASKIFLPQVRCNITVSEMFYSNDLTHKIMHDRATWSSRIYEVYPTNVIGIHHLGPYEGMHIYYIYIFIYICTGALPFFEAEAGAAPAIYYFTASALPSFWKFSPTGKRFIVLTTLLQLFWCLILPLVSPLLFPCARYLVWYTYSVQGIPSFPYVPL